MDSESTIQKSQSGLATAFPAFSKLPKELREMIWTAALPGPRIVYIERRLATKEPKDQLYVDSFWWEGGVQLEDSEDKLIRATCFTSNSPNRSITSLIDACNESASVAKKHYEVLFPRTSVWFCFEKDFLYLDQGREFVNLPYYHCELGPGGNGRYSSRLLRPDICPNVANRIQNIIFHDDAFDEFSYHLLPSDFPGLKLVVIADQFHEVEESGDELVWLRGELLDNLDGARRPIEYTCLDEWSRDMILWNKWSRYQTFQRPRTTVEDALRVFTRGYHPPLALPTVIRRSIVSVKLKQALLEICGSEQKLEELGGLSWDFVSGTQQYAGKLDLSQQIAYLQLVLSRINVEITRPLYLSGEEEIGPLLKKIEQLTAELESTERHKHRR